MQVKMGTAFKHWLWVVSKKLALSHLTSPVAFIILKHNLLIIY